MSLAELTQNCFQSGLSASKWLALSKILMSKENTIQVSGTLETNLSNSVLSLFRGYPGDPALEEYLQVAISDGSLSLPVLVTTMLQAARSPELHVPATITVLCRIALNVHYSSGLPSLVPVEAPVANVLSTVQDALALLRTAHTISITHDDQAMHSSSQLVILLLSCISDISHVSTAQAMLCFADASDLLQNFRLQPDVRQVLETFVLSLSLVIGDDAKVAREAQLMHSIQMALGKGHMQGNTDTDDITFGLFFHYLVAHRAHDFGSGDGNRPTAMMVALFRWSSWSPTAFYTQMFLCALNCMTQSTAELGLWRAFTLGVLLEMLLRFEHAMDADGVAVVEWRRATQAALSTCWKHPNGLIAQCDALFLRSPEFVSSPESDPYPRSFSRDLIRRLVQLKLVESQFAVELDSLSSNYKPATLSDEAQDSGLTIDAYIENRLSEEGESYTWVNRIWDDSSTHGIFASYISRRFKELTLAFDVENLGRVCQLLYNHDRALDLVTLHVKLSELISLAMSLIERYDCDTVGDPQTAVASLGHVVLFAQYTSARYHISRFTDTHGQTKSTDPIHSVGVIYTSDRLPQEESVACTAWLKALFDSNSEGIEDNILRSTKPRLLLKISSTIFFHAMKAHLAQKIDSDTLKNGVSYFTGPLLNWTLLGIVKALLKELPQARQSAPIFLELVSTLLTKSSCPRPVLCLCGPQVLRVVNDPQVRSYLGQTLDLTNLREAIAKSLKADNTALDALLNKAPPVPSCRHLIQLALATTRTGKPPSLDVDHCLLLTSPIEFLHLLWSELMIAASLGEIESCRRIATFVLTMPRSNMNGSSNSPPLLPIFLHVVAPRLIKSMDQQQRRQQQVQAQVQASESSINIELFAAVVSSILSAALHAELAQHSVAADARFMLGQPSSSMARKFAQTLHAMAEGRLTGNKSPSAEAVAKRLAGSQSFVANFPMFMYE